MEAAFYFVLFLFGILSQGICNVSEDNNEKPSNILIRRRRIIGGMKRNAEHAPFIVSILLNGNYHCPATLLTNDVAITSAQCVKNYNERMLRIQSQTIVGERHHEIVRLIFLDPHYNISRPTVNNLALIKLNPAININSSRNRPTTLFNGNLFDQDVTTEVFNWERPTIAGPRRITSPFLRSIFVRLISIDYCQSVYRGIIGRGNLCSYPEKVKERCHEDDTGAPIVASGQLLGIMVFHGFTHHVNPDVFMNLMDHDIRRWIHEHVPSLRLF